MISSNLSHRLPNKLNHQNPQLTILFGLSRIKPPKTSAGEGDSCLLKSSPADFRVNQSVKVLADDGAARRGK